MKYAYIHARREEFKIIRMCRWLEVSKAGYYRWRNREPSLRAQRKELIRAAVNDTYYEFKLRYGAPRIAVELNETGIPCSRNHIAEIMRELGLKARNGKRFKYQPSPEALSLVADNILSRDFTASAPNEKWVSDITYIEIDAGWVYLAVIMDLFSRQIIGWSMADHMRVELIEEAFDMAVARREVKPGLLLHSDRGVQYRALEYQGSLETLEITPSMSRKGNCWDNAAMESFFSRLKVELVYANRYETLEAAYQSVFEYIEVFYNRVRRHSANDYRSPHDYEQEFYARCA
ncbi:MAG: IS3 family transposase [Pseudomonadota bacterium]